MQPAPIAGLGPIMEYHSPCQKFKHNFVILAFSRPLSIVHMLVLIIAAYSCPSHQIQKTIIIPRFEVEREKETIHPSMDKNTFRNFWSNPSSDPWITQSCVYWNKKNVDIVPKRKKKAHSEFSISEVLIFFFYIPGPQRKITKLKRSSSFWVV